jgi:hypothetical protein
MTTAREVESTDLAIRIRNLLSVGRPAHTDHLGCEEKPQGAAVRAHCEDPTRIAIAAAVKEQPLAVGRPSHAPALCPRRWSRDLPDGTPINVHDVDREAPSGSVAGERDALSVRRPVRFSGTARRADWPRATADSVDDRDDVVFVRVDDSSPVGRPSWIGAMVGERESPLPTPRAFSMKMPSSPACAIVLPLGDEDGCAPSFVIFRRSEPSLFAV